MSSATTPRILIADDQPGIIEALRLLLKGEELPDGGREIARRGDQSHRIGR